MIFYLANKLLHFLTKLFSKRTYEYGKIESDEDAVRTLNFLAKSLRNVKSGGAGVSVFPIAFSLRQCYRTVLRKKGRGLDLYPFEKWILENYRLLYGSLKRVRAADFVSLPHADGAPRVCVLADFIVRYSGDLLTREKIENVVRTFAIVTPLTYPELTALRDAIAYRLLLELSEIFVRSVRYYGNRVRAEKPKFNSKYRFSDSYLFYYATFRGERIKAVERAHPEIDFDGARLGFENDLAANEHIAATAVNALRDLLRTLPDESFVSLSKINEIYSEDEDYRSMSDAARKDYLSVTYETARKLQTTESVVARASLFLAKEWDVHFGTVLYKCEASVKEYLKTGKTEKPPLDKRKVQGGYATAVLGISLLVAAFPAYYLRTVFSYFAVLPLFIAALHPVEYLIKRFLSAAGVKRPVPQMDYEVLPEKCKTVVAVSRFLSSEKDIDEAIRHISIVAATCTDENVAYSVVADFPESDASRTESDEKLLSYLREKELPPRVSVLIRHREKIGEKWGAYERKRGALLSFLSAVLKSDFSKFDLFGDPPQGVFAVLLDDDSAVLPGTIKASILALSHPLNAEYDLLTFGGKVNRYSLTTFYSEKYSRSCAIEAYPFYSDFYADRFDAAIYSGKAIVRIEPYVRKLSDFFPDGKILSHDVIEGAVLRSSTVKRCVYEDAPKTFAADVMRESRWQRGDVQLLPYALCPKIRKKSGERIVNPIAPIYKLVLFINGFSVLSDACLFTLAVVALFLNAHFMLFYAISILLFAHVYALVASFRSVFGRVRLRYVLTAVSFSIGNLAERLFLAPFRALNGAYLFFATVFKMATRSKTLLQWTPFRKTQKAGGFADGARIALPSVILSAALVLALGNVWFTLYAFLFSVYLFFLILGGKDRKEKPLEEKEKNVLLSYAKDIYSYFSEQSEDGLIPDNYQYYPFETKANMTSPTNLGFWMLSEVCAALLCLVDRKTALERIKRIFDQTEKLETWKGHLYNWYDVKTLDVKAPRVVSSVDSANYLACLSVVWAFAKEEKAFDLASRIDAAIRSADFTALFDKTDKLLAISKNVPEDRLYGRYDLLASESRLAYAFLIEQGADPTCYFSLGRDCSSLRGNTLLSWSGTAFEYMLPRLFMKAPKDAFLSVQEIKSFAAQFDDRVEGVFGRSECAYHDFNDATAYKYKAIGVNSLALSEECANVIAPYATFLYLPCDPRACVSNLETLEKMGLRGKFGFYESIDFDAGGAVVRTFMTHHQGMSLAAITNALTGDAVVRLFNERVENASFALLLAEENVSSKQPKRVSICADRFPMEESLSFSPEEPASVYAAKDGSYSIVSDSLGRSFSCFDGKRVNKFSAYRPEKGGFFFQIKENGEIFSPTFYPLCEKDVRAIFSSGGVTYENENRGVSLETYLLSGYNGEMRKLTVVNDGDEDRKVTVSGFLDLQLNGTDAYDSHPAFSDLFVSTRREGETVYAKRTNARCETEIVSSLTVKGLENLIFNTNRYNVPGRDGIEDAAEGVKRDLAPPFGDVLYPCFAFCGEVTVRPHSKRSIYVFMLAAKGEEEVKNKAERLSLAFPAGALDLLGRSKEKRIDLSEVSDLGSKLLFSRPSNDAIRMRFLLKDKLAALSVSPEEKIAYYRLNKGWQKEVVERFVEASALLVSCGIDHRLVVTAENVGGAGADGLSFVRGITASHPKVSVVSVEEGKDFEKCACVRYPAKTEERRGFPKCPRVFERNDSSAAFRLVEESGEGGFSESGYEVRPFGEKTLLPYANVVGAKKGGFVLTESGGGFSFGENSREDKLSVWFGDAISDASSESVLLSSDGKTYSLSSFSCVHSIGSSSFSREISGAFVKINVFPVQSGETKIFEIVLSSDPRKEIRLSFELIPALGWRGSDAIFSERIDEKIKLTNASNGKSLFVYALGGDATVDLPKASGEPFVFTFCKPLEKGAFRFAISSSDQTISEKDLPLSRAKTLSEIFRNAITVSSSDPALDRLYNFSLPYQVQSARLNAKAGLYQVSGAFGFRDQLQDVLSLLISCPSMAREQILLAASHQFEEGDVQHWWHSPRTGVRTRISDDRLWLCFVTEKYVSVTGDLSILDEIVPFLSSDPLKEGEQSRYEIPLVGSSAPLREHLLRAIRVSLSYGEHGLLKIGTGDWNDGLDRVGEKGRGESVWLTEFAYACIKKCLPFFEEETARELKRETEKLFAALKPLFKGGRYPLCFTDGGEWLGYKTTPKCTIALNPQTWAILSEATPRADAETALGSAKELVDPSNGIVKLSAPPFDETSNFGYISAYPKGVRENGGQYTHAAVWYVKALLECGKAEEAYRAIRSLNPILRAKTKKGAEVYKGEPYVLAGDVYGAEPYAGRAGWTWYTGSAAWLKYTLTEDFFGIKKRGDRLYFKPCLPAAFGALTVRIDLGGVKIEANYRRGGKPSLLFRGKEVAFVPLSECRAEEKIEVTFV